MSNYQLVYTLTESDFLEAYEAHWKSKKQSTKSNLLWGASALLLGGGCLFFAQSLGIWIAGILAGLGCVLLLMTLLRRFLHLRAYRQNPHAQGQVELTFGEELIEVKTPAGESQLNWKVYQKLLETEHFVLLYLTPNSFSIIPKQALGEKLVSFLDFLREKLAS